MSKAIQVNFEMSEAEFAGVKREAIARGMVDKSGLPNRAMIARTLVLERINQLGQQGDADRLAAVTAALRRDPSAITAVETALARRARRRRITRRAA